MVTTRHGPEPAPVSLEQALEALLRLPHSGTSNAKTAKKKS